MEKSNKIAIIVIIISSCIFTTSLVSGVIYYLTSSNTAGNDDDSNDDSNNDGKKSTSMSTGKQMIWNKDSTKCISASGASLTEYIGPNAGHNASVGLGDCKSTLTLPMQKFIHKSDGTIQLNGTDKCLVPQYIISSERPENNTNIVTWTCSSKDNPNHIWVKDGLKYKIKDTNQCINLSDGQTTNGKIVTWACDGNTDNSSWTF